MSQRRILRATPHRGRGVNLDTAPFPGWDPSALILDQPTDELVRDRDDRNAQRREDQQRVEAAIRGSQWQPARQLSGATPDTFDLGNIQSFFRKLVLGDYLFETEGTVTYGPPRHRSRYFPTESGSGVPPPPPPPGRTLQQRTKRAWNIPDHAIFNGGAPIDMTRYLCNPEEDLQLVAFDMPGTGNDCMFYGVAFVFNVMCHHAANVLGQGVCAGHDMNITGSGLRQEAAKLLYATNQTGGYIVSDDIVQQVASDFNTATHDRSDDNQFPIETHYVEDPVWNDLNTPPLSPDRSGMNRIRIPIRSTPAWATQGASSDYMLRGGVLHAQDRDQNALNVVEWDQPGPPTGLADGTIIRVPPAPYPIWGQPGIYTYEWRDMEGWVPAVGQPPRIPFTPLERLRLGLEMMGNMPPTFVARATMERELQDGDLQALFQVYSREPVPWPGRERAIQFISDRLIPNVMGADGMMLVIGSHVFPGLSIAMHTQVSDTNDAQIRRIQCEKVIDNRIDPVRFYPTNYNPRALVTVALYTDGAHFMVLAAKYPLGNDWIRSLYTVRGPASNETLLFKWLLDNTIRSREHYCDDWSRLPERISGNQNIGRRRPRPEGGDDERMPAPGEGGEEGMPAPGEEGEGSLPGPPPSQRPRPRS